MDLWKFLDVVDNKRLYLSRADSFDDKLEGRITNRKLKELESNHPLRKIDDYSEFALKKCTYISSWTCNEKESYPLWKIYTDYRNAVAIKSTIGKLKESIYENKDVQYLGNVKYVTENNRFTFGGNAYQLFYEKRKFFEFEQEVRLISTLDFNNYEELLKLPLGTKIIINPEKLIDEIFLAPLGDNSLKRIIESKLNDIGINLPVNLSSI
jgi:hypothetical protein